MELVLTHVMNFIYATSTLALVVLGLGVVFGLLGVMNMAHGEFVMLGAYSVLIIQNAGLHFLFAIPLVIIICGFLGFVIEWLIIRHLYKRPFDTLLATWGLAILIRKTVEVFFGRDFKSVDQVLPGTVNFFGIAYPSYRLLLILFILVFFGLLFKWYKKSNTAARIKAMVANPDLAVAMGINTQTLSRSTFIFGVTMAGLAGVALAPLVRVEPYMGLDYLLSSFFILVVGGLGTLEGLLLGTSVIGGTDVVISAVFSKTGGYFGVLVLSILFLWLRPDGLIKKS